MRRLYAFGSYATVRKGATQFTYRVYSGVVIDDEGIMVHKHTGRNESAVYHQLMRGRVHLYRDQYPEGFELAWIERGKYDARKDPGFAKALSAYLKKYISKPKLN